MGFIFDCLHPDKERVCHVCGKKFEARSSVTIYCCIDCANKDKHAYSGRREGKGATWVEKHWQRSSVRHICPMCGSLSINAVGCCREHQRDRVKEAWDYGKHEAEELIRRGFGIDLSKSEGTERQLYERLLKNYCRKNELTKKLSAIRKAIYLLKHRKRELLLEIPVVCPICKKEFIRERLNQVYCSSKCYRKKQNNDNKARNKVRRRCRLYGVKYDSSIRPIDVFERDRWICQLCGRMTNKKHLGTLKPDAPTIDHRKPLSKGGSHIWSNVQCACRRCNYMKNDGDKVPRFFLINQ